MKKRTVALAFLALIVALVGGTIAGLRTRWAADRICALAAERVERTTGLELAVAACRIRPLALELEAEGIRLGPASAPLFTADALAARLAPIQALGRQLHLAELRLVRPRVVVPPRSPRSGAGAADACPPPLLARFEVRHLDVEAGAIDVALAGGRRLVVDRIDVRSRPPARSLRAFGAAHRRARVEISAGPARLTGPGRAFDASSVSADVEVALDLSRLVVNGAEADIGGVRLSARGEVRDLCDPSFELTATAHGGVADALALAGVNADAEGSAEVVASVRGPASAPEVSATVAWTGVRIGAQRAGAGQAALRLAGEEVVFDRIEVPLAEGSALARGTLRLARGAPIAAEVELRGAELAEVLDRLGVRDPWVSLKLDGRAAVSGTLWPPALGGELGVDVRDLRALTRPYRQAKGDPGVVAFAAGRLESKVRVDREGLFFDAGRLSVGRGTVSADAAVHFSEARGFSVRARGEADLDALGRVADVPWAGLARVDATIEAAPYGNPHVVGRTRIERFRFLDVDLGNVSSDFRYDDFLLRFSGAEGARNVSRWKGEGVVDLDRTPAHVVSSRFEAKGRIRDLLDAVRDWLPRSRWMREVVDGDVEVSGTATGPADAVDAEFEARFGAGTIYGRRYDSGRAEGRIHKGVETRLDRAELRRGTGVARATGTWSALPPFPWDVDVSFSGVPIASLGLSGGTWSGTVAGTATLEGSVDRPRVRFAANGDAVHAEGFGLGTVQVGGTLEGERLVVTGGAEGVSFEGEATLSGRMPFRARARLAMHDVTRLLPDGAPAGFRARVAGEGTAEGELADLSLARARVRLDEVQAGYADFRVQSAGPAVLDLDRGRVEVQGLVLRGTNTELALSGARAASGQLDVSARGNLDLRLLGGLTPALRRPAGRLTLEAHVAGTAEEPVLVGAGRVEDAGFELREMTLAFSGLRGDLAFSQNRILFDGLEAAVNGGRARLEGEVQLSSFRPSRLRVEAKLDEIPLAVPAYLPVTLSGRLEATGSPDATTLTGRVHVLRARYTADVDLERSLLEVRRRAVAPPRAYDRAGEWLRFDVQVAVDGDARIDNDLVRGALSGELTLTGSLAAPGLVGTLSMAEGSRAMFRGNEFQLTHAILELTDRNRVALALDVHGESQVRDYQVFMHVFGPMSDPQITLTSAPALAQPDIITLLSLGFTRRDAAAGAGVGGVATAAAAQALFSASGLDEQVKRFLPRTGVMRDLSVRITSAYSEGSGQVEPRAEFESWFLRDKLRLRYQAPLAGARGQKAQAELRLGDHTAVQYQWDNDNPDVATGDHGVDLKLRWEWTDQK
ncbi:translocation/assembly module TamB domain-containing protein [Anaeromyxobacter sp. SG26]|uniref:translocation/assembly module TamB domain-containing protein n=1 Tax=Anaeromyxobacter sp. SG26 TaxID=2925407 RepID=UPI001F5758E5|nr:translocation/assembly module TamB [Anaeromyxobacter sp. SG26]